MLQSFFFFFFSFFPDLYEILDLAKPTSADSWIMWQSNLWTSTNHWPHINSSWESPRNWLNQGQTGTKAALSQESSSKHNWGVIPVKPKHLGKRNVLWSLLHISHMQADFCFASYSLNTNNYIFCTIVIYRCKPVGVKKTIQEWIIFFNDRGDLLKKNWDLGSQAIYWQK